ncbi:MAG TPA: DUF3175 domain-containing protein [Flavitalea sp.]|nr:DUF3175 domain-containing protein [Flavitalea sp.]
MAKASKKASEKAAPKKAASKKRRTAATVKRPPAKKTPRKWSAKVTSTSDALDLQPKIFESKDPVKIARSLKRSADKSNRRKTTPFQSAMSMLNFYINRAGKNLTAKEKAPLEKAKEELRRLYGKED